MCRRASSHLLALMIGSLLTLPVWATEPLLVVGPQGTEDAKTADYAHYAKLHHHISDTAGLDTRLQWLPVVSAMAKLTRGEAALQLGTICGSERLIKPVFSKPYATLTRHLISTGQQKPYKGVEQLKGLRLGLIEGYFYNIPDEATLKTWGIHLNKSRNMLSNVKLLLTGRVDVILAPATQAEALKAQIGSAVELNYHPAKPFSKRELCYLARDDEQGKSLIHKLNRAITQVYKEGTLEQFMRPPFTVPASLGQNGKKPL